MPRVPLECTSRALVLVSRLLVDRRCHPVLVLLVAAAADADPDDDAATGCCCCC